MIRRRILLIAVLLSTLFGSPAMAVEEAAFKSVLKDGDFEVRDYPASPEHCDDIAGGAGTDQRKDRHDRARHPDTEQWDLDCSLHDAKHLHHGNASGTQ